MKIVRDVTRLLRYFRYARPRLGQARRRLILLPVSIGLGLSFPWLTMYFIDHVLMAGRVSMIPWMIFLMAAAAFGAALLDAFCAFALQRAGNIGIYALRNDFFAHLLRLPRRFFDHHPAGSLLSRVTTDTEVLQESLVTSMLALLSDSLRISALAAFLFSISPRLTGFLLLLLIPSFFFSHAFQRRLRGVYLRAWRALSESTGYLQECLKGVKTIQLFNAEARVLARYEEKNEKFYGAQKLANTGEAGLAAFAEALTSIAMVMVLWAGARGVLEGTLSLGAVVAFLNSVDRLFIPVRDFMTHLTNAGRCFASLDHLDEIFAEAPEPMSGKVSASDLRLISFEELRFDNVSFRYRDEGPDVLREISFVLRRGERLAIVGPTGSGKSTVIRLLTGAYTGYRGSIKLNGIELSEIPVSALRRMIGVMAQDTHLFEETVGFNIALERLGITQDDVEDAAGYVYADQFIQSLPGNYGFQVGEQGRNLSAGQGQLLGFARSMAGQSQVTVLDEATSSVDSVTEKWIEKAIHHVLEERTVIAIAHRLSTIRDADRILVLHEGRIVESGRHEGLLAAGGLYASLARNMEYTAQHGDPGSSPV